MGKAEVIAVHRCNRIKRIYEIFSCFSMLPWRWHHQPPPAIIMRCKCFHKQFVKRRLCRVKIDSEAKASEMSANQSIIASEKKAVTRFSPSCTFDMNCLPLCLHAPSISLLHREFIIIKSSFGKHSAEKRAISR